MKMFEQAHSQHASHIALHAWDSNTRTARQQLQAAGTGLKKRTAMPIHGLGAAVLIAVAQVLTWWPADAHTPGMSCVSASTTAEAPCLAAHCPKRAVAGNTCTQASKLQECAAHALLCTP